MPKALSDRISPDYQKSAANAFVSLSLAILRARRSYGQIPVGKLYPRSDGIASWALNLRGYTFGPRHGSASVYMSPNLYSRMAPEYVSSLSTKYQGSSIDWYKKFNSKRYYLLVCS